MNNNLIIIVLILVLSACGTLSNKVESLITHEIDSTTNDTNKSNSKEEKRKELFCPDNNYVNLLLEDESTVKYYKPLTNQLFRSKTFSFIEKAAMLSLIELSRRPDEASPFARLQYYIRYNNKNYYYDFRPKNLEDNDKMSYLRGLDFLVNQFDNSSNLNKIAKHLDEIIPTTMHISPEFEHFLQTNRSEIVKKEYLAATFLKGDEVLTRHESFLRISFKKLISDYYLNNYDKENNYESTKNALFEITIDNSKLQLTCNVDINDEKPLKDEQFFLNQKKAHYYGLKEGNNFFIAVSSAVIQKNINNYNKTYLIQSRPSPTPVPICQFSNNSKEIILFSTEGRSSYQHLKHLVDYDIDQVNSFTSLKEILNFSRHLFLSSPDRILYESKRGRKSQLDFFLTMNFPIYHVDSIGVIVGAVTFSNSEDKAQSLVTDDRSPSQVWCSSE